MDGNPGLKGRLLVAQPHLQDPNFRRTVVFVLQHGPDGAIGVILNRPSELELGQAAPAWAGRAASPARVFGGGPVTDSDTAICLARTRGSEDSATYKSLDGGDVGTLDIGREPTAVDAAVDEIRLFSGYSGWSAGQLETELEVGGWWVVDARPADIFTADPEHLWQAVLGRQPGMLSWFAHYPPDPAMN